MLGHNFCTALAFFAATIIKRAETHKVQFDSTGAGSRNRASGRKADENFDLWNSVKMEVEDGEDHMRVAVR